MGATYVRKTLPGDLSAKQVEQKFIEIQEQDRYEHGHDAYSGTFGTVAGVEIVKRSFDSVKDADAWLDANCKKWGSAKAVRARDVRKTQDKKPTFPGEGEPYSGYILATDLRFFAMYDDRFCECGYVSKCFKEKYEPGQERSCVPANELSGADKKTCVELYDAWGAALKGYHDANGRLNTLLREFFQKLLSPFDDYAGLREARNETQKAAEALLLAQENLVNFDEAKSKPLYAESVEDHGFVWVVGAIAAS